VILGLRHRPSEIDLIQGTRSVMKTPISRRNFASTLAVGTAGAMAFPYISQSAHHASAANKLNVACVGIGHMGNAAVKDALSENIVALCGLR
jgi:hypothetical protein